MFVGFVVDEVSFTNVVGVGVVWGFLEDEVVFLLVVDVEVALLEAEVEVVAFVELALGVVLVIEVVVEEDDTGFGAS